MTADTTWQQPHESLSLPEELGNCDARSISKSCAESQQQPCHGAGKANCPQQRRRINKIAHDHAVRKSIQNLQMANRRIVVPSVPAVISFFIL